MGLLDRLLRRTPDASEAPPLSADEAVARWRFVVAAAPAEALSEAHARGLEQLGETSRVEVLQRLRSALSALDPGAVVPTDAAVLVRAAARAERRAPGFLERALAADVRGRQTLTGLAAAVVASSAAAPFLRGFRSAPPTEALAESPAPELDVDAPGPSGKSGDHGDDLADED